MTRNIAVDAVIIEDRKILLIKRGSSPFKGYYALPGGHVEKNENLVSALIRETKEETGLNVEPVKMVDIYDSPKRDIRGTVSVTYICKFVSGVVKAGTDSKMVKFFEINRLPNNIAFDHKKIISDSIKKPKSKKVLCGGVFNLIHPGHLHFLKKAKALGDELTVVIANDRTVKKNRKKLLFPSNVRKKMVESVKDVDNVLIGSNTDMMKVVMKIKPDVIALGYDQNQKSLQKQIDRIGYTCKLVKLGKLKGYSTKKITG